MCLLNKLRIRDPGSFVIGQEFVEIAQTEEARFDEVRVVIELSCQSSEFRKRSGVVACCDQDFASQKKRFGGQVVASARDHGGQQFQSPLVGAAGEADTGQFDPAPVGEEILVGSAAGVDSALNPGGIEDDLEAGGRVRGVSTGQIDPRQPVMGLDLAIRGRIALKELPVVAHGVIPSFQSKA